MTGVVSVAREFLHSDDEKSFKSDCRVDDSFFGTLQLSSLSVHDDAESKSEAMKKDSFARCFIGV